MRKILTEKNQYVVLLALWFVVTCSYLILRSTTILIWDDSPALAAYLYDIDLQTTSIDVEAFQKLAIGQHSIQSMLVESFSIISGSGYRPLSFTIGKLGLVFFSQPHAHTEIWFAAIGAVFGALAVTYFLVARHYLRREFFAWIALFLFIFSAPVITAGWVVFKGIQAFVPLIICLGLLTYWKIIETDRHKALYTSLLCLVFLVGPWFREFIGLLPVLVIIQDFQRTGKLTWLKGIAILGFLHALFPTALIKLLFFQDLPLEPVFSMGLLGSKVKNSNLEISSLVEQIQLLKWPIVYHFVNLFPPSLITLSGMTVLSQTFKNQKRRRLTWLAFITVLFILSWQYSFIAFLLLILLTTSIPSIFQKPLLAIDSTKDIELSPAPAPLQHLGSKASFFEPHESLQKNYTFLVIWFLLSLIPFLKVFTAQVHLAYCLVPASILIVASLEILWESTQRLRRNNILIQYSLFLVILIGIGDQVLNLYGSYQVVRAMNNGIVNTAKWFENKTRIGSIVIANALHAEDIRLNSANHFTTFWTTSFGIPHHERGLDKPYNLAQFLKQAKNKQDIYFLDVDFKYTPDKIACHTHKYVRNKSVAMNNLGIIHTTKVRYPYLDPLKLLTPRAYISFMGSPDLENDIYRGPAQDGTPFLREVYAEYHVYQVTGVDVDPFNSCGSIRLYQMGYKGFNILTLNDLFLAIHHTEGEFELEKIWNREYSLLIIGNNAQDVIHRIDEAAPKIAAQQQNLIPIPDIILLEQGYKGFNIISYQGKTVYAIPQGEGAFEIKRIQNNSYKSFFIGDSVSQVKQQIDKHIKSP